MRRFIVGLLLGAAASSTFSAEQTGFELGPIVITATRTELAAEKVASSVTVITREEIERRQTSSVAELLRTVPGVDILRAGPPGGQTSVFTRGTESNHTLVLIDGVEAGDPSNPTGQFDFASILVDDIERIEIVRGPQSTLYGSDALGGVIHIITRRGARGGSAYVEGGEYRTWNVRGGAHGGAGGWRYGGSLARQDTEGFSAASERRGNSEEDGYENTTLAGYLGYAFSPRLDVDLHLRRVDSDTEIDETFCDPVTFACRFTDDGDSHVETGFWLGRAQGAYRGFGGRWVQRFGISYTDYERTTFFGPEPASTTVDEDHFEGRKLKFDWQHDLRFHPLHLFTLGLESEEEKAHSEGLDNASARTNAFFVQDQINAGGAFSLTLGLREDDHEQFGSHTTWRATPAWRIGGSGTRLRASYGTGFKAPALFELFDDTFGTANPDLKPETSKGWDAGIEQQWFGGRWQASATYYKNDVENLINCIFDPATFTCPFINIDRAETRGYELATRVAPFERFSFGLNYTRGRATDKATDEQLLRRPRNKGSLFLDWQFLPQAGLTLTGRHFGARSDIHSASFATIELDSYTVLDLALRYDFTRHWRLSARVENLDDERYEEIHGFGAAERSAYVGLAYRQ